MKVKNTKQTMKLQSRKQSLKALKIWDVNLNNFILFFDKK